MTLYTFLLLLSLPFFLPAFPDSALQHGLTRSKNSSKRILFPPLRDESASRWRWWGNLTNLCTRFVEPTELFHCYVYRKHKAQLLLIIWFIIDKSIFSSLLLPAHIPHPYIISCLLLISVSCQQIDWRIFDEGESQRTHGRVGLERLNVRYAMF